MINYEIIPGLGFEQVKIGMSTEQLKQILGEPDEIENLDDEFFDDVCEAIWHYNRFYIYPVIDTEDDMIVSIMCDHPDLTLNNVKVMKMSIPELKSHLKNCGAKVIEEEDDCIECPNYGLNVMIDCGAIDLFDIEFVD
ncbi:MAG: hypothetical protein FWF09_07735 [Bacteroidales bacterium]|nr:hypothetical protein [Bacteroidales bacterium]